MRTQLTLLLVSFALSLFACEATDTPPATHAGQAAFIAKGERTNGLWRGVVALIERKNDGTNKQMRCTGTLIDPEVVLTAAHCVQLTGQYDNHENPQKLRIKTGGEVGFFGAKGVELSDVAAVEYHPEWNGGEVIGQGVDVAVLRLATPVTSEGTFCVWGGAAPQVGDTAMIVGYGMASDSLISDAGVRRMSETTIRGVEDKLIEIGTTGATCTGDSGGPLFLEVEDGRYEIGGVTSYGQNTCAIKGPSYSANTMTYRDWIEGWVKEWTGHGLEACSNTDEGTDNEPEDSDDVDTVDEVDSVDTGEETDTGEDVTTGDKEDTNEPVDSSSDSEPTASDNEPEGTDEEYQSSGGDSGCAMVPSKTGDVSLLGLLAALL